MIRNYLARIGIVLAAPAISAGLIVGTLNSTPPKQLADFGANETAEIGQEHARDAGVRHMSNAGHLSEKHSTGRA